MELGRRISDWSTAERGRLGLSRACRCTLFPARARRGLSGGASRVPRIFFFLRTSFTPKRRSGAGGGGALPRRPPDPFASEIDLYLAILLDACTEDKARVAWQRALEEGAEGGQGGMQA